MQIGGLPDHGKLGDDILMYTIDIPGRGELQLAHAVFDFNGTLANTGDLLPDLNHSLFRCPICCLVSS